MLPAPGDEAVVVATTGGIVTYANQNLAAGYAVKKDDKLFNINTKNLGEGDYYARVNANYEKALAAYRRAQGLLADKIVSKREYEAIQLEFRNAKIAYDAIAGQKTPRGVRIVSPMGGYVKNVLVKDGEYVTEGQAIATVSQNRRLVLRADVSEKYFSVLKSIRTANFRTPYDNRVYELEELSGKLLSVGKAASDNTFFVPVSFEFDNCGEVIPGSFVEVFLISSPMERVVSIPVSALTNEMGYFYVYKQLDEEGYRKQEQCDACQKAEEDRIGSEPFHRNQRPVARDRDQSVCPLQDVQQRNIGRDIEYCFFPQGHLYQRDPMNPALENAAPNRSIPCSFENAIRAAAIESRSDSRAARKDTKSPSKRSRRKSAR